MGDVMNVLVIFANPRGTSSLRLGEEDRKIQECIQRSKHRDKIQLTIKHAVTVDDIRRALLDDDFEIVHFSGHGTGNGLAFEDNFGGIYVPPRVAVADLLAEFAPVLKCVLLNACYSTSQGRSTSLGLPFTIAMEGPISDNAAIIFTGGFYDSIGAGKDIEFSFRQGIHALSLSGHPDSAIPQILRKGEYIDVEAVESVPIKGDRGVADVQSRPLLVGIGLDVSGSMESNINNKVGCSQTRLEGFRESLYHGINRSKSFLDAIKNMEAPVKIFAYAFGLRTGDVCDLFSLVKAADSIISNDEIENLKERYTAEIKRRYSGMGGLADIGRNLGFGGIVDSVEGVAYASGESEVRNRILAEVQQRLSIKLETVGELTLSLNELVVLWQGSSTSFEHAEGFIFGGTPMCEALRKIKVRFQTEIDKIPDKNLESVLLLVSDGEPTDGNPEPIAKQISKLGVTIICCYITDEDVGSPRTLYGKAKENWPSGAQLMFRMSSHIPEDSPLINYLLRESWTIAKNAKAFIQVNHSEILEELVGFALSPIEAGYELLPKGL